MGLFLVFRGHIYLSGLLFLVSTFVDLAFCLVFHSVLYFVLYFSAVPVGEHSQTLPQYHRKYRLLP